METGPVGERLSRNLRALRDRMTVRELSAALKALGRPILPSGITKIEQGARRVDVDDLVALALALGVTPNRLLLDAEAGGAKVKLTPKQSATQKQAWSWATGEAPLPERPHFLDLDAFGSFRRVNRPHDPDDETGLGDLPKIQIALQPVLEQLERVVATTDVTFKQAIEYLDTQRVVAEISESLAREVKHRRRRSK